VEYTCNVAAVLNLNSAVDLIAVSNEPVELDIRNFSWRHT
jgi:hypothetical protein